MDENVQLEREPYTLERSWPRQDGDSSTRCSFQTKCQLPLALLRTELTCEKIWEILVATPGMIAPAATATKPAISAYSIRSCPLESIQILRRQGRCLSLCMIFSNLRL